ncbi:tetraspanin-3-like [Mya arenaria]|uniref:tetraspanin-3-like n=1 Tax=Mya arenaria TaxID=6604 RepID=UPI0022E53347|nr:tetraspanin-3-like [Mya arenaria]
MGACTGCGQLVLVLINILFSVVGIALLVVACLVRFGSGVFDSYLEDGYTEFKLAVEIATKGKLDISGLDIGDIVGDAAIAFIVIGAFFFVLGIFGCCGAICKAKSLLVIYAVVLGVIFLAEVIFVILLFTMKSKIDGWIQGPLEDTLNEKYTGSNGSDPFTLTINFVMREFECCGIKGQGDFNSTTSWRRPDPAMVVPYVCCMDTNDTNCVTNPTSNNSYTEGCYNTVNNWLTDNKNVLIGVGSGVAAVQMLLIICSVVICCQRRREKLDDSYDSKDDIPIQPYRRELPDPHGHNNPGYHGAGSYPDLHREPGGYGARETGFPQDNLDEQPRGRGHSQPYQGRTDLYTGPPEAYGGDRRYHR